MKGCERQGQGDDLPVTACVQALGTQWLTRQALAQGLSCVRPSLVLGSWWLKHKHSHFNSYPGWCLPDSPLSQVAEGPLSRCTWVVGSETGRGIQGVAPQVLAVGDSPPPLRHTVLLPKSPELWAKVTAPAAHRTSDYLSTAELEQSGHCAKNAAPLAKQHPIPSLPDLCWMLIFRGLKLGKVVSQWPWGGRALSKTLGKIDGRRRQ